MPTIYRNNFTQLSQLGVVAYLQTQPFTFIDDLTTGIVGGISSVTAIRPLVVVQMLNAEAAVPFEGNWEGDLTVELRENADDTSEANHHAHAGELFSVFLGPVIATADLISAAYDNFQCQYLVPKNQGYRIVERSWYSQMTFRFMGCGTDLV